MQNCSNRVSLALLMVICVGAIAGVSVYGLEHIISIATSHRIIGAVLFSLLMFSTTVIAPLTSLPLVPVIAPVLGPFTTGLASFIGWTLGAVVAFLIGRYGGRPYIPKKYNLDRYTKYEKLLSAKTSFLTIVALRMLVPVDALSYALGLVSNVSLKIYTTATMLGIVWFSFAFAYLGDSLIRQDYVLLVRIGVASVTILVSSFLYVRYAMTKKTGRNSN